MKRTAIKKIAIRIPNWIGDALLSTPFIRYTAKYFPNVKIYLIFRKSVEPLFKIKDYQAEHILIDDKQDGLIKTGSFLREFKFDLYFNLPESISSLVRLPPPLSHLDMGLPLLPFSMEKRIISSEAIERKSSLLSAGTLALKTM